MTDLTEIEIQTYVQQLTSKAKTLREVIESLGPEMTSPSSDTREEALRKLSMTIAKLPDDFLGEEEVALLLEFFLGRVEDSALSGGSVIYGLHHLVLNSKKLPEKCEVAIFQGVYKEGNVQSWSQKDRMRLLELLEFMLKNRVEGLKTLGFDFILSFMRAVGGERDPRCLIKVFQLYTEVVKNFDLGVFVEDMFELVACYYPVDYKPAEKLDIDEVVTREALVAGLESCLLAHKGFSLYVFQLIGEKLLDDENADAMKLEICGFLTKSCKFFYPSTLITYLDDYMTAFRAICLNPSERTHTQEIPAPIKNAISAIVYCLRKDEKNAEEALKSIADTSVENCEPFVLQAEMGLSGKALNLLQCLAEADKICARWMLPRIFYFLGMLINADTVNAPQNKNEIILESMPHIPMWTKIARVVDLAQPVQESLLGILNSFKKNEENLDFKVSPVPYQFATELLLWHSFSTSDDLQYFFEHLLNLAFELLTIEKLDLSQAIYTFLRTYAEVDLQNYVNTLKKVAKWDEIHGPTEKNVKELAEICCISIVNEESEKIFGNMVYDKKLFYLVDSTITVEVFKFNQSRSETTLRSYLQRWITYVSMNWESFEDDKKEELTNCLHEIGYYLPENLHEEFFEKIARSPVAKMFVLQTKNFQLLEDHLKLLLEEAHDKENIKPESYDRSIFLTYMALINKSSDWQAIKERYSEKLALLDREKAKMVETKALFVAGRHESLKMIEELFSDFIASSNNDGSFLVDFLDFFHEMNPEKNKFVKTIMWRQRCLCQFVPIYVKFFHGLTKDKDAKKSRFFAILIQILQLAREIPVPQTHELMMILPIFTEALPRYVDGNDGKTLELLLDGLLELMKMARIEEIPEESLKIFLANFAYVLGSKEQTILIKLKTLDCLELLARRALKSRLLPYQQFVIHGISKAISSPKRVMRQKAANVRNLWELLST